MWIDPFKVTVKKEIFFTTRQRGIFVYKRQFNPFNMWHWMFLVVRQGNNEWSFQIDQRDREFPPMMGTIKVKLRKIRNIPK